MNTGESPAIDPEYIITHAPVVEESVTDDVHVTKQSNENRLKKLTLSLCCCITKRFFNTRSPKQYKPEEREEPSSETDKEEDKDREKTDILREIDEQISLKPHRSNESKICLVIDLDETLVHSTFKPQINPDFIVSIEIDRKVHQVYVGKRPHVDQFISEIGPLFECILFTASLSKYADPVVNLLDQAGFFHRRLFRESCIQKKGYFIKDLNIIGKPLNRVAIIDNSPSSYLYHTRNAIPIKSWFGDPEDTELINILPALRDLANCVSVYDVLPLSYAKVASLENVNKNAAASVKIVLEEKSIFSSTSVVDNLCGHQKNKTQVVPVVRNFSDWNDNIQNGRKSIITRTESLSRSSFTFKSFSNLPTSCRQGGKHKNSNSNLSPHCTKCRPFVAKGEIVDKQIIRGGVVLNPTNLSTNSTTQSSNSRPSQPTTGVTKTIDRTWPLSKIVCVSPGKIFSPSFGNVSSML